MLPEGSPPHHRGTGWSSQEECGGESLRRPEVFLWLVTKDGILRLLQEPFAGQRIPRHLPLSPGRNQVVHRSCASQPPPRSADFPGESYERTQYRCRGMLLGHLSRGKIVHQPLLALI